jgi:voltage-gated sodium channel
MPKKAKIEEPDEIEEEDDESDPGVQIRKYKNIEVDEDAQPAVHWIDATRTNVGIGVLIVFNAITIGLETDWGSREGGISNRPWWYAMELFFCLAFSFELIVRMKVHKLRFFCDAWNLFDFVLVAFAVMETLILAPLGAESNFKIFGTLRVVRMFRLVRLIRLLKMFKELWLVVNGLMESLKTLGWVSILLLLFLYIMAIFTTMQIGQQHGLYDDYRRTSGGWDHEEYFGDVPRSMYTLFQVLTLENWADGIARHVMSKQPEMVFFFVIFLMFTSFGIMNLVVGVIVENTLSASRNNEEKIKKMQEKERTRVLQHLRDIFLIADEDGSGTLTLEEFEQALKKPDIENRLKLIELETKNAMELFYILDHDGSKELSVDEFIGGCVRLKGTAKSKDLLAVQISVETLSKRLDQLEDKLEASENKVMILDAKTRKMANQASEFFAPEGNSGRRGESRHDRPRGPPGLPPFPGNVV